MAEVKTAPKATATKTTLPKEVFAVEVNNHELLQRAYQAYLANGRANLAVTKTRGLVRGGGRKPWRQKGTGRARFGSSRNPIWRGGGIVFGPTGNENYSKTLPTAQKRQALRQALTISHQAKKITVIESFVCKDGKVKSTIELLAKYKAQRNTLIVVAAKDEMTERATRNVPQVKVTQARYLNVYDVLNADTILVEKKAIEMIQAWLSPQAKGESK